MKKINSSIGILLLCGAFACSKSSGDTGAAGSGGTPAGAAGTSGAAGTGAAGHLDASTDGFAIMQIDGRCVANAYAHEGICMCQPSTPTVCAEGCTDTSSDSANCGGCGIACGATATCNNGTCGPAATNLLPAVTGCTAMQIALAGATIYYSDSANGKVSSVPVAGGAPTMIASGEASPSYIAASGTTVYWVTTAASNAAVDGGTATSATIRKSVGGAAATTLVTEVNGSGGIHGLVLSADGNTVYYSADTKIREVAAAGGTAADVANEVHGGIPGTPAILGSTIAYGTGLNADVDVVAVNPAVVSICGVEDPATGDLIPASNPGCTRVARSQGGLLLTSMILNGTKAYWGNNSALESNSSAPGVAQANIAVTNSTGGGNISALAANATTLYFGVGGDNVIEKTAYLAAGATMVNTAKPLARAQKTPTSLALDATNVYWSTSDCSISSTGL